MPSSVAAYSNPLCLEEILIESSDCLRMFCGGSFPSKTLNWKLTALVEVCFFSQCICNGVKLYIEFGCSCFVLAGLLVQTGANLCQMNFHIHQEGDG